MARPILAEADWWAATAPWTAGYMGADYTIPMMWPGVASPAALGMGTMAPWHVGMGGMVHGRYPLGMAGRPGVAAPWAMGPLYGMMREPVLAAARPDTVVPMVRGLLQEAGMVPAITRDDTVAVAETPDLSGVAELPGWRGIIDLPFLKAGVVLPSWRLIWDWPGARVGLKADVDET